MGIFDFVKDAGGSLFGGGKAAEEAKFVEQLEINAHRASGLKKLILDTGMSIEGLQVESNQDQVTIRGTAASQSEREKIVLLAGNTKGVARVKDEMTVAQKTPEPEAIFYTVKAGDTLSKIAKEQYGSANKYMAIFQANQPMLKDPNKIYPGQVLRIPPQQG